MKFPTTLITGKLVRRYRRFLVDVELKSGSTVTAHCPNAGTMVGCSKPGQRVLLSENNDERRRNKYTWELIRMNQTWVGVNVSIPRKIVVEAIAARSVPSLSRFTEMTMDVEYGHRRKVDIMLHGVEQNVFINVHHVAWAEQGVAKFPETPNARSRKGLLELAEVAQQGHRAVAFFVVQRGDCESLSPAHDIDPQFWRLFKDAQQKGVEVIVYRANISPQEISLGTHIPCETD